MSAVEEAAATLLAALKSVKDVRVHDDPGANLSPPATVLGPPSLTWEGYAGPTSARFLVYVVVAADDRALKRLWGLVPTVADALDAVPDAAVVRADPGTYLTGGTELPCYEIQVDFAL